MYPRLFLLRELLAENGAIFISIDDNEVATFSDLYKRVKQKGDWKDETIWQHLIGLIVNLPPARHHWKNFAPFLFLHGDGRYELYDSQKHPKTIE
jgi:hypothetical protein